MASCGIQLKRSANVRTPARILACLAFIALLTGCASTVRYGSPPKVDRLETLKTGVSTASDVRQTLGEPRGHGKARLTQDFPHHDIWFYEYVEVKGSKIGLDFLLVFFNKEAYDGYLWFSSAQLLEKKD